MTRSGAGVALLVDVDREALFGGAKSRAKRREREKGGPD